MRKPLIFTFAVALHLSSASAQNILINGDFEQLTPGTPTASITGWTKVWLEQGFSSPLYVNYVTDPTLGVGHCVMIGYFFGLNGVKQSFATIPGQAYAVSFYGASDINGTLPGRIQVSIGGGNRLFTTLPANPIGATPNWQQFSFSFQAPDAMSTLQFLPNFEVTGSAPCLIDSVVVSAVPEPGTITIATLGLLLVSSIRMRRGGIDRLFSDKDQT